MRSQENLGIKSTSPYSQFINANFAKKQLFVEFIGAAALLCVVIGSGIMAERLSGGNLGVL
jgi:hypothetical protein